MVQCYHNGLFQVCQFSEYQKEISKHTHILITGFNGVNEESYKYVIIP